MNTSSIESSNYNIAIAKMLPTKSKTLRTTKKTWAYSHNEVSIFVENNNWKQLDKYKKYS